MRVRSRVFRLPKDPGYAKEYEDACALDIERGRAAIADGVSSAIFSGLWARILTEAAVADPPDVMRPEFWDWLAQRRREWAAAIDPASLTFFQRGKLQQCGGAFSTLLWLEWQTQDDAIRWRCKALGDGGMLHVRKSQLIAAFPIVAADDLHADPLTIASAPRSADQFLEFGSADGAAQPGDWLVLTTDALLGWALRNYEAGLPPDWNEIWNLSDDGFGERVARWRETRAIRADDTTLMLLQVTDDIVEQEPESVADHTDGYAD
jgi:hypothetical protein